LLLRVSTLRKFLGKYLSEVTVVNVLPNGMKTNDSDHIVKVLKRTSDGIRILIGNRECILRNVPSFAEEGSVAKLRGIARI